ncbi:MAG: DJ-1/PfpI family protein [Clostridia bacterium]|nr:DJ-1/PfpI family protein [Clostridia bacterium]
MVYLFLADGFEDIEALATVDILRRAGILVKTVGIGGKEILSAHKVLVNADILEKDVVLDEEIQAVILPGGGLGTENLDESDTVKNAVKYCYDNNKYICAICAAPSVIGKMGLLSGKCAVCYPGFEEYLYNAKVSESNVCEDGIFITGKGPGCTFDFAFSIVSKLKSEKTADSIKAAMQC